MAPGGTFIDDDTSIFEGDIEAIAAVGVTKGCNAQRTEFCPERAVTRGEMAAFLVRAMGLTDQDPAIDFTDDNDSIFEDDIENSPPPASPKAATPTARRFCPNRHVTRGEMAAFLVRAIGLTDQDPAIDFTDDNDSIFEDDIENSPPPASPKAATPTAPNSVPTDPSPAEKWPPSSHVRSVTRK